MPLSEAPRVRAELLEIQGDQPASEMKMVAGGANGADKICEKIARELGWQVAVEPVNRDDWAFGGAAGRDRNQHQLSKHKPNVARFFHHSRLLGKGTLDMYMRVIKAGVPFKIVLYPWSEEAPCTSAT